uniref:Gnk2-homologous domain-containing protein n=1 Tax=Oryza nivara TaxID=4536 RepID=A0A0E0GXZ3_ORYNI
MPCPSCRCNSGSIVFLLVEVVAILFTGATSKDTTNPFTSLDCPSPPPSASPSPPSSAINSTFQSNVLALLDDLPSAAGPTGFASLSRGEGTDRAFVRGMCRGDSTPDDCATYLRSAVLDINGHCNSNRRAAIWYDKCFLSYADTNASTAYENSYHAELYNVNNVTDKVGFERTYYALMSRLRARAANDTARMESKAAHEGAERPGGPSSDGAGRRGGQAATAPAKRPERSSGVAQAALAARSERQLSRPFLSSSAPECAGATLPLPSSAAMDARR